MPDCFDRQAVDVVVGFKGPGDFFPYPGEFRGIHDNEVRLFALFFFFPEKVETVAVKVFYLCVVELRVPLCRKEGFFVEVHRNHPFRPGLRGMDTEAAGIAEKIEDLLSRAEPGGFGPVVPLVGPSTDAIRRTGRFTFTRKDTDDSARFSCDATLHRTRIYAGGDP